MNKDNENDVTFAMGSRDVLTEILRTGVRKMLIDAIDDEVNAYLEQHADHRDEQGYRLVVRNGVRKGRKIETGVGLIEIDMPKVDDQRLDEWQAWSKRSLKDKRYVYFWADGVSDDGFHAGQKR
jgi:transposase-like protein